MSKLTVGDLKSILHHYPDGAEIDNSGQSNMLGVILPSGINYIHLTSGNTYPQQFPSPQDIEDEWSQANLYDDE